MTDSKKIDDGGPAAVLPLVNGGAAVISEIDAPAMTKEKWRRGSNGYVYRVGGRGKGVTTLLHRIVTNAPRNKEVHHLNGVKEDCRRENLILVSPSEHQSYHRDSTIASNKQRRLYAYLGTCKSCGRDYVKDPDHRGRQTCCSKLCAIHWATKSRVASRDAMIAARKGGAQ